MQQKGVQLTSSIRESLEKLEEQSLSNFSAFSLRTKGREQAEDKCPLRTDFQRDRDRILHSKAFRRLKHKTQVFISPVGDHYRTRLTHSLEVAQVSRTIARALRINEDLTEAIALGHDLGHPPFGHNGEEILNELHPDGYRHEQQSVRIARFLEPLNLTHETLNGMASQLNTEVPETLEAQVVKIADRMTYLRHDMEDALRAGLTSETQIPGEIISVLGEDFEGRLNTMVIDLVTLTRRNFEDGIPKLAQTQEISEAMGALRKWMFKNVYLTANQMEQKKKVRRVIEGLYEYFCEKPERIPTSIPLVDKGQNEKRALDYIAGMTDRFANDIYIRLLMPNPYIAQNEDREGNLLV